MKSILMSIHPKWCEKIFNGEKTIEVRKHAPKPPFKVVVYCTKNLSSRRHFRWGNETFYATSDKEVWNGKVIGEFICNEVEKIRCATVPYEKTNNLGYEHFIDNGVYQLKENKGIVFEREDCYIDTMLKNEDLSKMCLSANELLNYCGGFGKNFKALHITAPVRYDKPRELGEFKKAYKKDSEGFILCDHNPCDYVDESGKYIYHDCVKECPRLAEKYKVTHAPQSYMEIQDPEEN